MIIINMIIIEDRVVEVEVVVDQEAVEVEVEEGAVAGATTTTAVRELSDLIHMLRIINYQSIVQTIYIQKLEIENLIGIHWKKKRLCLNSITMISMN